MTFMSFARRTVLAFVILATAFIFLPSYADSFVLDDYRHIEFIRVLAEKPWQAYKVASPFWIGWYYRPVQHWLILTCYLVFGVSPFGYYVVLTGIHATNIVLLSRLARAWRVGFWGAMVSASLFALNSIHQDVLGWISSISVAAAGFFILTGTLSYMHYLDARQPRSRWLVLTLASWILALFSREESVVFVFICPLLRILYPAGGRLRRDEGISYAVMLLLAGLYAGAQVVRPTWTARPGNGTLNLWLASILEGKPVAFLARLVQSLFAPGLSAAEDSLYVVLAGAIIGAGLLFWLWRGTQAARFGLILALGFLALTYLLTWLPQGGIVPGRYLYLPWLGITLAIGAAVSETMTRSLVARAATLAAVSGLILLQLPPIFREQQRLYAQTRVVQDIRRQMLSVIPEPDEEAHFFAYYLFPVTDYVQSMAVTWYDQPFPPPGGHLGRLQSLGFATEEFVVLNYEEGVLFELMPELREARESHFVWREEPVARILHYDGSTSPLDEGAYSTGNVVGPPGERRYGFFLHPPSPDEGWASLAYEVTVPQDSTLRFAIFKDAGNVPGEDGMTFRVRALTEDGTSLALFEEILEGDAADEGRHWREVEVDMEALEGSMITLQLEVHAGGNLLHDHGYWANPRFVVR